MTMANIGRRGFIMAPGEARARGVPF